MIGIATAMRAAPAFSAWRTPTDFHTTASESVSRRNARIASTMPPFDFERLRLRRCIIQSRHSKQNPHRPCRLRNDDHLFGCQFLAVPDRWVFPIQKNLPLWRADISVPSR